MAGKPLLLNDVGDLATGGSLNADAGELAQLSRGSLSRLSNVVKRLEQRGFVRRETDPTNGRYTNAVLTEAGWDCVVHAAPGHVNAVRQFIFDPLSAEQVEALGVIGGLIADRICCGSAATDIA